MPSIVISRPRSTNGRLRGGGTRRRYAPRVTATALPGIERHPHAKALLLAALPPAEASHAYLFAGPAGSGKRAIARAFAAALIADGAPAGSQAAERVARGTHPDLTWVRPSGAAEMLVSDIDEPVVAAATRTPFESRRRVFVVEQVETMGDTTANRMLKTLEEPAEFVHLILLTDRPGDVLPTVASRCQHVRFEAPTAAVLAEALQARGVAALTAQACARLALGDGERATALALGDGPALRAAAATFADCALRGELAERPWAALTDLARRAGDHARTELDDIHAAELELTVRGERVRLEREHADRVKRVARRASQATLDLALALCALRYRDAAVIAHGAPELVHALDVGAALERLAREHSQAALQRAIALVASTREALQLNVTEELALEALAYRIAALA
jgi:DNA polymerase-3 subunit delta'